jgi:hypothetical protein
MGLLPVLCAYTHTREAAATAAAKAAATAAARPALIFRDAMLSNTIMMMLHSCG